MSAVAIRALRKAFAELFGRRQNLKSAIERLTATAIPTAEVGEMIEFIRQSKRGVAFGMTRDDGGEDSEL